MIYDYEEGKLKGVFKLIPKVFKDERGSITKIFHRESFEELGLDCDFGETLITKNYEKGVIRGFHYQREPYGQSKVLFAACGSFINIVLDIRKGSQTYREYEVFQMKDNDILYVPKGFANCYCILEDNTTIIYNMTSKYMPDYAEGFSYNSIDYKYPFDNPILSEKDKELPML